MNSFISFVDSGSNFFHHELIERYFDEEAKNKIEEHCLASGNLGGKSIGLLLAWQILQRELSPNMRVFLNLPLSYFIGSDEFDIFLKNQEIAQYIEKVEKNKETIDYPVLKSIFARAPLSKDLIGLLKNMLEKVDELPVIVRSSSVLEDQFGSSFAGMYRSIFCSNLGNLTDRLQQMELAIKEVYASAFSPNAVGYRNLKGFGKTPEKMAILIQVVDGQTYNNFYFPTASGIAFSQNPYCWTERLDPRDGFLRLVWGLGTQAVQSTEGDYPRLIGLTNPRLRPENTTHDLFYYSQHHVDVINIENGKFETLPVKQLLKDTYPALDYVASIADNDTLCKITSKPRLKDQLVISFDQVIENTALTDLIKQCLKILAEKIGTVINIEFSANLNSEKELKIGLLQCRQLAWETPKDKSHKAPDPEKTILRTNRFLYSGEKTGIEYVVFINPDFYTDKMSVEQQIELSRALSSINQKLTIGYLLVGPGRWGSIRPDLGVPIQFSDIYNAKALLEIRRLQEDIFSATYGTHFFMDLVEARIPLLATRLLDDENYVNLEYFEKQKNIVNEFDLGNSFNREGIKVFRVPQGKITVFASVANRKAHIYLSD